MSDLIERLEYSDEHGVFDAEHDGKSVTCREVIEHIKAQQAEIADLKMICFDHEVHFAAALGEISRLKEALHSARKTLEKSDKYGGLLSIGAARTIIDDALFINLHRHGQKP